MSSRRPFVFLAVIAPGVLVAATGVGAGDLATGAFVGIRLGVGVVWAVVIGAFLKFVLNEGLARYQLATGRTLLEGAVYRIGRPVQYLFLPYLVLWSFFVGSALMTACGDATHAIFPVFDDPQRARQVFGIAHSILGMLIVSAGGFKVFEKIMGVCIAVMFVTAIVTAVAIAPQWLDVVRGFVPQKVHFTDGGQLSRIIGLMGGVGGTLTVLCYGYWIREAGRAGGEAVRTCRIDLAVAYSLTALFGIAIVIIASTVSADGLEDKKKVALIVALAQQLESSLGASGKWLFLVGAWAALFSSLLGVWQSVPYIFTDFWEISRRHKRGETLEEPVQVNINSLPYRFYLAALAIVPMFYLLSGGGFEKIQLMYAILGACFMPMLAAALLVLNGRSDWVGAKHRNRWYTVVLLCAVIAFFGWVGFDNVHKKWSKTAKAPRHETSEAARPPEAQAVTSSPVDR